MLNKQDGRRLRRTEITQGNPKKAKGLGKISEFELKCHKYLLTHSHKIHEIVIKLLKLLKRQTYWTICIYEYIIIYFRR